MDELLRLAKCLQIAVEKVENYNNALNRVNSDYQEVISWVSSLLLQHAEFELEKRDTVVIEEHALEDVNKDKILNHEIRSSDVKISDDPLERILKLAREIRLQSNENDVVVENEAFVSTLRNPANKPISMKPTDAASRLSKNKQASIKSKLVPKSNAQILSKPKLTVASALKKSSSITNVQKVADNYIPAKVNPFEERVSTSNKSHSKNSNDSSLKLNFNPSGLHSKISDSKFGNLMEKAKNLKISLDSHGISKQCRDSRLDFMKKYQHLPSKPQNIYSIAQKLAFKEQSDWQCYHSMLSLLEKLFQSDDQLSLEYDDKIYILDLVFRNYIAMRRGSSTCTFTEKGAEEHLIRIKSLLCINFNESDLLSPSNNCFHYAAAPIVSNSIIRAEVEYCESIVNSIKNEVLTEFEASIPLLEKFMQLKTTSSSNKLHLDEPYQKEWIFRLLDSILNLQGTKLTSFIQNNDS